MALTDPEPTIGDARWSPDGTQIAFWSDRDGNREVYVMNADGSGEHNLTQSAGPDTLVDWTPDGSSILFVSERDGSADLWLIDADGTDPRGLNAVAAGEGLSGIGLSPDGSHVVFGAAADLGTGDVYEMSLDGTGRHAIVELDGLDINPALSGSARLAWMNADTAGTGALEIYTADQDGTNQVRVTNDMQLKSEVGWRSCR